jgi:endogenous inhibitor of DNA gyrase (YacG/DUF329 family)
MESTGESNSVTPDSPGSRVCPTCRRPVTATAGQAVTRPGYFPFCSGRCKLIDLGAWLDADYRIADSRREQTEAPAEPPATVLPEDPQK